MEELSQHILDIAFNSLEAGATELTISVQEDIKHNLFQFKIIDNGRGITAEDITKILDPFYTTKSFKRVGLGVPLLQDAVDRCGGNLEIKALLSGGTSVTAVFPHDHLDRAPLGDITGTLITLITGHQQLNLVYRHRYNRQTFIFETRQLKTLLRGIPLHTPEVLVWLKNYLNLKIIDLRRETNEEFGRAG